MCYFARAITEGSAGSVPALLSVRLHSGVARREISGL